MHIATEVIARSAVFFIWQTGLTNGGQSMFEYLHIVGTGEMQVTQLFWLVTLMQWLNLGTAMCNITKVQPLSSSSLMLIEQGM